jgi:hypothetical protein
MPEEPIPIGQTQPEWLNNRPIGDPIAGLAGASALDSMQRLDDIARRIGAGLGIPPEIVSQIRSAVTPAHRPLRGRTSLTAIFDDMSDWDMTESPTVDLQFKAAAKEIYFNIKGQPYLKITEKGFFVKNLLITDDQEIYTSFVEWLNTVRAAANLPKVEAKPEEPKGKSKFNRYTALKKTTPGENL